MDDSVLFIFALLQVLIGLVLFIYIIDQWCKVLRNIKVKRVGNTAQKNIDKVVKAFNNNINEEGKEHEIR